jgi:group I intron endonuclease
MVRRSGIYSIRHLDSDRRYIGSAVSIYHRWAAHRSYLTKGGHQNSYLQRAWVRYGADRFIFEVIEYVDVDLLIEREQHWLNQFARPQLFNLRRDARSNKGIRLSDETRQKLSVIAKRRGVSPKCRAAAVKAQTGKKATEATRAKMVAAKIGKIHSDAARLKMSEQAQRRGEGHIGKIRKALLRTWLLTDPAGAEHIVTDIIAFAKQNGLSANELRNVADRPGRTHKRWVSRRLSITRNPDSQSYIASNSDNALKDQAA